ncbi:hypothetical protein [Haladaptatus sp. W1]|uniref:hypothetical protein n=1 Tax=Haladaptatus sp. W1 TaxID=1897478 RepID=UPI000AB896AE|nr:hypothetical protein [Haladaptatus sp. W1]
MYCGSAALSQTERRQFRESRTRIDLELGGSKTRGDDIAAVFEIEQEDARDSQT